MTATGEQKAEKRVDAWISSVNMVDFVNAYMQFIFFRCIKDSFE